MTAISAGDSLACLWKGRDNRLPRWQADYLQNRREFRLCPQVGDIRLALHDGTLRLLAMMLRQFVVIAARLDGSVWMMTSREAM